MTPRRVVFTAVTGSYESLNETPVEVDTDVPFICFTDDPALTSNRWTVVHVPRWFPSDPMRSQRVLKISGHPLLDEFDETLYIDNTVRLRVDPRDILAEWLSARDLAIPVHSFRKTVREEFDAVAIAGLDTSERLAEQLDHYVRDYPDVLTQTPHWNGMIARRRSAAVRSAMDLWLSHVMRYSRRDQLSLNVAVAIAGLEMESVRLDNHTSRLHEWPVALDRKPGIDFGWHLANANVESRLLRLSTERDELREKVAQMQQSSSWRMTAPLRQLAEGLRRPSSEV